MKDLRMGVVDAFRSADALGRCRTVPVRADAPSTMTLPHGGVMKANERNPRARKIIRAAKPQM